MSRSRRLRALLVVTIALSGCLTMTAPRDFQLTDASNEGLVIVSFTHRDRTLKWMYRDLTKGKGFRGGPTERWMMTTVTGVTEPIQDGDTWIMAVVLRQGDYEFYRWTQPEAFFYNESITDFSVRFKALAGKAVYIGDLHMTRDDKRFRLAARDLRERHVPLLKAQYPNITDAQIETHLMEVVDPGTRAGSELSLIALRAR
jgi:hypothetical protein